MTRSAPASSARNGGASRWESGRRRRATLGLPGCSSRRRPQAVAAARRARGRAGSNLKGRTVASWAPAPADLVSERRARVEEQPRVVQDRPHLVRFALGQQSHIGAVRDDHLVVFGWRHARRSKSFGAAHPLWRPRLLTMRRPWRWSFAGRRASRCAPRLLALRSNCRAGMPHVAAGERLATWTSISSRSTIRKKVLLPPFG